MKRVLLLKPPHSFYPLGMSYVASTLDRSGIPYRFYDTVWGDFNLDSVVKQEEFDICGIGGLGIDFLSIENIVKSIKAVKPETICVLGGQITRDLDPDVLFGKIPFDVAALAEAEVVLPDIIRAMEEKCSFSQVPGLIFRDSNGELSKTGKAARLDLSEEGIRPSYDFFDHAKRIYGETIPVLTGRGCNGACTFCAPSFRPFKARSFSDIFADIAEITNRFGVKFIDFWSEVLFSNEDMIIDFCREYKKLNLPNFWCFLRADQDPRILEYLHHAGCVRINVGLESGSDSVLRKMGKGLTVKQSKEFIKAAKRSGIKQIYSGFMVGNEDETKADIDATIALEKKLNIGSYFHFTVPYPGTAIYKRSRAKGIIKQNEYDYLKIVPKLFHDHDFQTEMLYQTGEDSLPILPNQTSLNELEFVPVLLDAYVRYVSRYALKNAKIFKKEGKLYISGKCDICGTINITELNEHSPVVRNMVCDGVAAEKCNNRYMCHAHIFEVGKVNKYVKKVSKKLQKYSKIALYGDNFIIKFILDRNIFKIKYSDICAMSPHVPDRAGNFLYGDEFGNNSAVSRLLTDDELLAVKPEAIVICLMPPMSVMEKERLASLGHDADHIYLMCSPEIVP